MVLQNTHVMRDNLYVVLQTKKAHRSTPFIFSFYSIFISALYAAHRKRLGSLLVSRRLVGPIGTWWGWGQGGLREKDPRSLPDWFQIDLRRRINHCQR